MLRTSGIHHITAIASDPQRNLDFYTRVLGLRLVKQTVNFDDPGTYHFYFGDEAGSPGTILTFFPWPHVKRGVQGAGSVIATAYAIPAGALAAWEARLDEFRVVFQKITRFGQTVLAFEDPDGMGLELVETAEAATLPAWAGGGVPTETAIRGFHGATLLIRDGAAMKRILTHAFGMDVVGEEGSRTRYLAKGDRTGPLGAYVDVVADPQAKIHKLGGGIVHHIAMRAKDDEDQGAWSDRIFAAGLRPTPVADRFYFKSIYFREPQGVLFEIATDGPGFDTDEPRDRLGGSLKLPPMYEKRRADLERILPKIALPETVS